MAFYLFILVNATLFIRPAEIIPGLEEVPFYEMSVLACILAALPGLISQFSLRSLKERPISLLLLMMPAAVLASLVPHALGYAVEHATDYCKIVLYFWLFIAIVNTPDRIQRFMVWIARFVVVLTALAVLQYFEAIDLPALSRLEQHEVDEVTGESTFIPRLRSTGIFNDPNDLSLILLFGIFTSLFQMNRKETGFLRFRWIAPLGLFVFALALTKSRGGFLGFLIGLFILFRSRFGWWRSIVVSGLLFPPLLLVFSGRQTDLSATTSGSGQDRVQLWSEGLTMLRESPLVGIGYGLFADEASLVAHNSFVHCFAELGLFGGTLFLGAFLAAFWTVMRVGRLPPDLLTSEVCRLRLYLLAIMTAFAVGLMTLSRAYFAPTYMILGLAAAFSHLQMGAHTWPVLPFNARFVYRLGAASFAFLMGMYVFVRLFANFGA